MTINTGMTINAEKKKHDYKNHCPAEPVSLYTQHSWRMKHKMHKPGLT